MTKDTRSKVKGQPLYYRPGQLIFHKCLRQYNEKRTFCSVYGHRTNGYLYAKKKKGNWEDFLKSITKINLKQITDLNNL